MQILLILALVSSAILPPPSSDTFEKALGRDRVNQILAEVFAQYKRELHETFVVTNEALRDLKTRQVPARVLQPMGQLKNKEYIGESNFIKVLDRTIGKEETTRFGKTILNYTRGYLEAQPDFIQSVNRMVIRTETPEREDAGKWLKENHERFLAHIISLAKTETRNRIILSGRLLDLYLKAEHCGEIPCSHCCGSKCRSCKK